MTTKRRKYSKGEGSKFTNKVSLKPMKCRVEGCTEESMVDADFTESCVCWKHSMFMAENINDKSVTEQIEKQEKAKELKSKNRSEGLKAAWDRRRANGTTSRTSSIKKLEEQYKEKFIKEANLGSIPIEKEKQVRKPSSTRGEAMKAAWARRRAAQANIGSSQSSSSQ